MDSRVEAAIIAAVFALIGSLSSAIIVLYFNERSKEKDRNQDNQQKEIDRDYLQRAQHLDLYKVVYPEMVKAATNIMGKAGTLCIELQAFYVGAQDQQE